MNRLSIFLFALVLVSCGSLKTSIDYEKSVDFGKYNTYGFWQKQDTIEAAVTKILSKFPPAPKN